MLCGAVGQGGRRRVDDLATAKAHRQGRMAGQSNGIASLIIRREGVRRCSREHLTGFGNLFLFRSGRKILHMADPGRL